MILKTPINEIVILSQPRRTFSNIDTLAADIREHGLLQPITITKTKRLLYGERRYRACKSLGMDVVDTLVCEEELTDDQILERQIAENVAREDLSWQERTLSLLDLFRIKRRRGALEGWTWGQSEAASLFKMSVGTVNYVLRVAKKLEEELTLPNEKRKYWNYESAAEAYRIGLLAEEEDRLLAEQAKESQKFVNTYEKAIKSNGFVPDLPPVEDRVVCPVCSGTDVSCNHCCGTGIAWNTESTGRSQVCMRPADCVGVEQLKGADNEVTTKKQRHIIYLSNTIQHDDCISFMEGLENVGRFDHIITDPPYAIDVSNLDQGRTDIDRVVDAHDVEENEELFKKFFPAAFKCTKDSAFVICFCDPMQFRYMHDLAVDAGFAVQRWPMIWRKINQPVGNSCAQYNTTKDYELILVARKPSSTLGVKLNTSIIDGSNVEATRTTGHPFAKPAEVVRKLIETFTLSGQTILEPFAGCGSIAIEILRQKRNVVAVEKETHHYNMLLENIKTQYYLKLNSNFQFM